jgi:hypothetical protein
MQTTTNIWDRPNYAKVWINNFREKEKRITKGQEKA